MCQIDWHLSTTHLVNPSAASLIFGQSAAKTFAIYYAPARIGKGAISVVFVRPSVCPSVAYTANNSRTKRPSVPKFGRKVPRLWCDSHTSFKVKMSRSPGPLMPTNIRAPYLQNSKAYKLQTWYTDGGRDPYQPQAPWPPRSKVKVAKVTWLVWAVLAHALSGH